MTIFDLSELSEAAAHIENAISWNDTDPQIVEYEDDDDDHYEEDVDWYAGDCDDELDDTEYTAGTPTDVGFTFAGGETEAASTNICIPHAEFPQGISVNDVSNESTPFLIGFDVLREHGLVIDYHYNRVSSHILKRDLPRALIPTGHLALEKLLSISEWGQHPVASQALSTRHWAYIQGHGRKERCHLSHPYFIFMTRSRNTSTDTLPRARTIC